jgi:hypothetical protein
MVRRRVGGLRKGSEKRLGVLREGRNRGLRFKEVKGRGFYTGLYSRL